MSDIEVADTVHQVSGTSNRDLKSDQKDVNLCLNRKRTLVRKHREENSFVASFTEAKEKL